MIWQQTNVYPNAQKRKVRPFEGMIRKAIVIVPSDEDYKARIEAQEKEETKDVPDNALFIYGKKQQVETYNNNKLNTLESDIVTIQARHIHPSIKIDLIIRSMKVNQTLSLQAIPRPHCRLQPRYRLYPDPSSKPFLE